MSEQNKKIKCLAYYDTLESIDNRMNSPAAFTKTSYVIDCFQRLGYDVDILSASYVVGNKSAKGKTWQLSDKITLKTLFSMGRGNLARKVIARILFGINYFLNLLTFVKKGDTVWVYHAPRLMWHVGLLKKIKKFNLILEVEEIYGYVFSSEKTSRKELEYFKCADGYIFCTDLLEKSVNISNKPYAIVHGTYKTEPVREHRAVSSVIHCVYAGTLDPRKGALNAVKAALYLDCNYHIHILGFGSDEEINFIKTAVDEVSAQSSAKVTYDGLLSGKEYTDFLARCSVGLCTQEADAQFNGTSFPSKVLVYMANGLRVVSIRIPAIEKSDVGEYMYFYDESTPEAVAKAIESIDFNSEYNGGEIIRNLDAEFIEDLKRLLKDMENK